MRAKKYPERPGNFSFRGGAESGPSGSRLVWVKIRGPSGVLSHAGTDRAPTRRSLVEPGLPEVRNRYCVFVWSSSYPRKKIRVMITKIGIRNGIEYLIMYPKKEGIGTSDSSAIDFTMKLGAFPM